MFGRLTTTPVLQLDPNVQIEDAVADLLEVAEQPQIARWIEFRDSLLLFAVVSGTPQSGAIYWLDRRNRTWYLIDFEDQEYGGYNLQQFDELLQQCGFLMLIERPGLLRSGLPWILHIGNEPEARLTETTFRIN